MGERGFAVKELGHLVLYVKNIERSARFYSEILGFRQVYPDPGEPYDGMALFSGGRTHHELLLIEVGEDAPGPMRGRRAGMYHFGLKIGDSDQELRAALEFLLKAGVKIVGASDHTVSHSLYLEDPDGNEVELYVDVPGVDWRSNPKLVLAPIKPLRL